MVPDPNDARRQLVVVNEDKVLECPQLKIICIHGSLFFGAANYVSEIIEKIDYDAPRHLLLVAYGINFVDVSGAMVLAQEAKRRSKLGKKLYFCCLNTHVYHFLKQGEFLKDIHKEHIFNTEYDSIGTIVTRLDNTICARCGARIFKECQQIPRKEEI